MSISKRSKAYKEMKLREKMNEACYERGRMDGLREGRIEGEKKAIELENIKVMQARTELLKAAAEVAVTFSKVMYNINMIANGKLPFNQPTEVEREMRFKTSNLVKQR